MRSITLKGVGNLVIVMGLLGFGVLGLFLLNEALQKHPFMVLAFWVFLPIVMWWLKWEGPERQFLTHRGLKTFTSFAAVSVTLLSILIFLNWQRLRDDIGRRYVQGYFVTHDTEITENGPQRTSMAYAEHWYAQHAISLLEAGLLVGIFGFPTITFVLRDKALQASASYEELQSK